LTKVLYLLFDNKDIINDSIGVNPGDRGYDPHILGWGVVHKIAYINRYRNVS